MRFWPGQAARARDFCAVEGDEDGNMVMVMVMGTWSITWSMTLTVSL